EAHAVEEGADAVERAEPGGRGGGVVDGVAPVVEEGGVDAAGDAAAEEGELLAPVEARGEVAGGFLATADGGHVVGRALQPAGEGLAAGSAMGVAEALEHRAGAEDVEVGGVGVVLVEELAAGDAEIVPAVFETGEAEGIPREGAADVA